MTGLEGYISSRAQTGALAEVQKVLDMDTIVLSVVSLSPFTNEILDR